MTLFGKKHSKTANAKAQRSRILRRSSNPVPAILLPKNQKVNNIAALFTERDADSFWYRQRDFYLYSILLGNTVDGMSLTMHYATVLSGGVYILMHCLSCVLFVLPVMRLEFFYGKYSKLSNSQMYRMAGILYGFCMFVLIANYFTTPLNVVDVGFHLFAAIINLIHSNAMKTCPKNSTECYDIRTQGKINTTCLKDFMGIKCEGYPGIVKYVGLYRTCEYGFEENATGNWQFLLIALVTWLLIILFLFAKMKFLGNFLLAIFSLSTVSNIILYLMAGLKYRNVGGTKCIMDMFKLDFRLVNVNDLLMSIAFTTSKLGLIRPSGCMTRAAYVVNWRFQTGATTLLVIVLHGVVNVFHMGVIYSAAGIIASKMGVDCGAVLPHGAALYSALFSEIFAHYEVPIIFILIFYLSHWLLDTTKVSIMLHILVLNVNDLHPRFACFRSIVITIFSFLGIVLTMVMLLSFFRENITPMLIVSQRHVEQFLLFSIEVIFFTYIYGINRIFDDIEFVTGSRPLKIWMIYTFVFPILCPILTYCLLQLPIDNSLISEKKITYKFTLYFRIASVAFNIITIAFLSFVFIIKHMKKNRPASELVKPAFFFGPPSTTARINRKLFHPHISMRSHYVQRRVVYRDKSIQLKRRLDELQKHKQGRIFIEDDAYINRRMFPEANFKPDDKIKNRMISGFYKLH